MSVGIRDIRESDYADWLQLWTGYLDYYETTLPETTKRHAFNRLLSSKSACNGYLAVIDDCPVGLVHYIFHEHMWRPEGICYLQDLFTAPEARGAGVGQALIEAVYDAADTNGIPRVYWLTQDFNVTARKLYDRVGKLTPFLRYDRP